LNNLQNLFNEIINDSNKKDEFKNPTDNINSAIFDISSILLQVLLCKGQLHHKRYICVLDNIEYYVNEKTSPLTGKRTISDREVGTIINSLHGAVGSHSEIINENEGNNKEDEKELILCIPTFMVVTRPVTVRIDRGMVLDHHFIIEITDWFCPREIYDTKLKYLNFYADDDDHIVYETLKRVFSDCTMSKWSLAPFLSNLFNRNYRRMVRIIKHVLKSKGNKEELADFNRCWDENQSKGQEDKAKTQISHLLRMRIVRMLLDSFNIPIDNYGTYFSQLMVEYSYPQAKAEAEAEAEERRREASSFTRKILTILHRTEIENSHSDNNESTLKVKYLDIEDLLSKMFLDGTHSRITDIDEKTDLVFIARILFLMNEVTDITGWVPLTALKWNKQEKPDESSILKMLITAKNSIYGSHDQSVGIRITHAGRAFLRLLPEFEYFAARFCRDNKRLMMDNCMQPQETGKQKNGDTQWNFPCVEIIDTILNNKAYNCAKQIIARDTKRYAIGSVDAKHNFDTMYRSKTIYRETVDSPLYCHPARIFKQQRNYVNSYIEYVNSLSPNEKRFKTDEQKESLLSQLNKKLDGFNSEESHLRSKYPNYFRQKDSEGA
jgi:hypothetical protein